LATVEWVPSADLTEAMKELMDRNTAVIPGRCMAGKFGKIACIELPALLLQPREACGGFPDGRVEPSTPAA